MRPRRPGVTAIMGASEVGRAREVGMLFTVPLNEARVFVHSVAVEARPATVFRALTEPAELRRWFPLEATLDLRPGGSYEFRCGEGTCHGEVLFVAPEDRLSFLYDAHVRWWHFCLGNLKSLEEGVDRRAAFFAGPRGAEDAEQRGAS